MSKNGHTHHNNLVVFIARIFLCMCETIHGHQNLLLTDSQEIQRQMQL